MKKTLFCFLTILSFIARADEINPLFTYGDFSRFKKITNLDETQINSDSILLKSTSTQGYLAQFEQKYFFSAGFQALENLPAQSEIYPYIGLGFYPQKNGYFKVSRQTQTREEAHQTSFKKPHFSTLLKELQPGDAFYWNTLGGANFFLPLGADIFVLGPKISLEGGYSLYLEKKSSQELYLEFRILNYRTLGLIAGAYIAYAELTRMLQKTQGLAFSLNLSHPEAEKAYQFFLNGQVGELQTSFPPEVVKSIASVKSQHEFRTRQRVLAVPFVPVLSRARGQQTQEYQQQRQDIWSQQEHIQRRLNTQFHHVRWFGKKTSLETHVLYERILNTKPEDSLVTEKIQMAWSRQGNRIGPKLLKKSLSLLAQKTDLSFLEKLTIHQAPTEKFFIGFLETRFLLEPSSLFITHAKDTFALDSTSKLLSYFQKFWKSPDTFQQLLNLLQICGGAWNVSVKGEFLAEHLWKQHYKYLGPQECETALKATDL